MAETNKEIAKIFQQMADVLQILDANRFRIIAHQKAARVIGELTADVCGMSVGELTALEGIGKGTAEKVVEFCESGEIVEHKELLKEIPKGLPALLDVPGLGAKTVALLWKEAGVVSMKSLEKALKKPETLTSIKGLGKKKIENIAKNLAFAEQAGKRHTIGRAYLKAVYFVAQMRQLKEVENAAYAGSLRRSKETIGDIDILVAGKAKDAGKITEHFKKLEPIGEVLVSGKTKTSVRTKGGIQVDLRIVEPGVWGAALMYFTGSKEHNVRLREIAISKGMSLSEYGLVKKDSEKVVAAKTEEEVYGKLGLEWIAPELREDRGEVDAAMKGKLPKLITMGDIKAELHAHTHASDGHMSIRELVGMAYDRGFHTIAVTDHSKSQIQAHGLDERRLEQHIKDIHAVRDEMKGKIHVLAGSEVDILADGKLDYPNSLLKELDIVVASPHSALAQETSKCTARLIKAIENPYVHIIGHATGRLLLRREGYHPDMAAVLKAAADRGVAMEINANQYRLDLRDTHAKAAIEAGCLLAINTDTHRSIDFNELMYGVGTARRAWVEPRHVVNCFGEAKLMKWLRSCRP